MKKILFCTMAALLLFAAPAPAQDDPGQVKQDAAQALFDEAWALMDQMDKDPQALDKISAAYEKALEINPDNEAAYWKLSEVTFKKGQAAQGKKSQMKFFRQSLKYAEKSVELNPSSTEGYYWMAVNHAMMAQKVSVFSATGFIKKAQAELEKCMQMEPENRFATLAKAVLAAIKRDLPWPMKDLDQAEKLSREATEEDPNLTIGLLVLGKTYALKGDYPRARQILNQCLAVESPTYAWDSRIYDWPEAREILEQIKGKK